VKGKYTARTGSDGRFRINNVWLGSVTGVTGGAGDIGGWGEGSAPQLAEFDFPLYFDSDDYAPWKEQVALSYEYIVDNGTIVIPSGTFFEVGRTGMMPYVQSFSGTVYAGPGRTPARGVTVMLDHEEYPSSESDWPYCKGTCPDCEENDTCDTYQEDYVRLVNSFAVTDDNGMFMFDLDDRVVAYDDYRFIVTPYDIPDQNFPPGCSISCEVTPPVEPPVECIECECLACVGDGIYEYDSMDRELNLEPKPGSGFDLMGYELDGSGNPIVVQTHEFAVNLRHGSNSLELIYCSLSNMGGGIVPVNYNDFVINVSFNYPLRGWVFRLLKDQSIPVAIKVEPTSSANISFDITPLERLSVNGNTYRFEVYAVEDYMGNMGFNCNDDDNNLNPTGFCYWDFNVAGYVPPIGPIAPSINVNVGGSQTFSSYVPDRRVIYRLYKDFGPTAPEDVLVPVMLDGADDLSGRINLIFGTPSEPVGSIAGTSYFAFVRNSKANPTWDQVPVMDAFDDGQQVEGSIYLPSYFRQSAGGDNNYLGEETQIHITILPVNEDGSLDVSALDGITPSNYLALEDGWGPMIVDENTSIYGSNGTMTTATDALYDETGKIAVHEVLDASVAPTVSTDSQNFTVSVPPNNNNTFVEVEFSPTITATLVAPAPRGSFVLLVDSVDGFYPGDQLAVYRNGIKVQGTGGPGPDQELDGYARENILIISNPVSLDLEIGDEVALLGPMQEGVEEWETQLRASTQNSAMYIAVAPDPTTGLLPGQSGPAVLVVGGQEVTPVTGVGLPTMIGRTLRNAYPAGTSAQSASETTEALTVLLEAAADGDTSIVVEDASMIAVGDWLRVGPSGNRDYVNVASIEDRTINFAEGQALRYSYAPRTTEIVGVVIETDSITLQAYPLIDVAGGIDNLLPGSPILITDGESPVYATTVESTYDSPGDNNWIGLADLPPFCETGPCEGGEKNFEIGSAVIATSTRTEDTIQINVTDTSGNTSQDTDKDNDGQADFDQLELWLGGMVK
jgi:hypothetical protein